MIQDVAPPSSRKAEFRVLVVEDEPRILLNIVKKIPLADPGFRVIATAENGVEALRLTRSRAPDLILTDIVMPMMDGLELARAVRAHNPTLPIAIISGYAEFEYARQAISLGVEHYLLKPVKVDALREMLRKVRAHLEGSRREEEIRALHDAVGSGAGFSPEIAFPQSGAFVLLCLGNILEPTDTVSEERLRLYESCWRAIDADPSLTDRERITRHWFVEIGLPNQRLLVISCGNPSREWILDCTERIFRAAAPVVSPWAVTILFHPAPQSLSGVYEATQQLRAALCARLVPGRSRMMTVTDASMPLGPQNLIEASVEARLRALKRKGERAPLLAAVTECFQEWVRKVYPQKIMEKGFDQLISLLECDTFLDADARDVRRCLREAILAADQPALIPHVLAAAFDAGILRGGLRLDARGIVEHVEEKITRDYIQPLNLKEMSRTLGFDLSHVTRVFKKITGETPLHRLTRVRLQKAMQLLSGPEDIDVGTVGAMVGYGDAHYFARIFKKVTGMSPSEWRARVGEGAPSAPEGRSR